MKALLALWNICLVLNIKIYLTPSEPLYCLWMHLNNDTAYTFKIKVEPEKAKYFSKYSDNVFFSMTRPNGETYVTTHMNSVYTFTVRSQKTENVKVCFEKLNVFSETRVSIVKTGHFELIRSAGQNAESKEINAIYKNSSSLMKLATNATENQNQNFVQVANTVSLLHSLSRNLLFWFFCKLTVILLFSYFAVAKMRSWDKSAI